MKTFLSILAIFILSILFLAGIVLQIVTGFVRHPEQLNETVFSEATLTRFSSIAKPEMERALRGAIAQGESSEAVVVAPLVDVLLDAGWWSAELSRLSTALGAWIRDENPSLVLDLDLSEKKRELAAAFDDILLSQYLAFPLCQSQDTETPCRDPEHFTYEQFRQMANEGDDSLVAQLQNIPNSVDLLSLGGSESDENNQERSAAARARALGELENVRNALRSVPFWRTLLIAASVVFLVLLLILHRGSLPGALRWLGVGLIVSSGMVLLVVTLAPDAILAVVQGLAATDMKLPAEAVLVMAEGVRPLLGAVFSGTRWFLLLILFIGLVCLLVPWLARPKRASGPILIRH